ncbi:hypothetical protein [Roseibium polysiphoniae]|uniref:hypothetical protein n=1 Tax=Roseibium polysiphoniae TaxID=2571221 RepID=UPI003299479C
MIFDSIKRINNPNRIWNSPLANSIKYTAIVTVIAFFVLFFLYSAISLVINSDSVVIFTALISIGISIAIFEKWSLIQRKNSKFSLTFVIASEWSGDTPLILSVPQQGFTASFNKKSDFEYWLRRHIDLQEGLLGKLRQDDTSPPFLRGWIEWQLRELQQCTTELRDKEYSKAATHIEGLVEQGFLFQEETPAGSFVLQQRDDQTVGLQMLAATMFFKIPSLVDEGFEREALQRKFEVLNWQEDLQLSGESRVLYELSINTSRTLAEISQKSRELEVLKAGLEQALEKAIRTLELKPAANRWQRSARLSSLLALIGLLPFLMLLIGLPLAVWLNWQEVSAAVAALFYAEDEKTRVAIALWTKFFTDAPWATFVFVTVPVLLFAWTLKHFSRIFVQNMNLASDAGRRAALADVYTRIVSDPDLNKDGNRVTDEQKKIIFEAMFRPRDARHTDDGIDHSPVEKLIEKLKDKD